MRNTKESERDGNSSMSNINTVEKYKKDNRSNRTLLQKALFSGLVMSVITIILWFCLSRTVKSVGLVLFSVIIVLAVVNTLIFKLLNRIHRIWRIFLAVFTALLNTVILLSVTIYTLAPTQLFYQHFDEESYNKLKSRTGAEELTVQTDHGDISGWMLHNAEDSAPLVLYFCGNGENSSTRMIKILEGDSLNAFAGCNIAIFDYPGYGKTDGKPSDITLRDFGLAAFDAIAEREDVDQDRIIVFGYSMGTGVADYVASKRDTAGLILMAPYADGYDLYNGVLNIFHGPLRLLVGFRMDSVRYAENITVRPLIMASTSDAMVNYDSSVRLSKVFPSGCIFKTFDNTGHNDFWGSQTVYEYIADYLTEVNK